MSSRRRFLATSSTALGAAALGLRPLATAGAQDATASAAPLQELPPAIKALRPMVDGVVPISVDERRARLEKARGLMREHGLDALVLTGGTSMEYFTGMKWGISERLLAAIIPSKGTVFLVTPAFEEERALEQAHAGPLGADAQVYAWEEDEDPYALVAQGLRERGLASATVGAEETTRFVFGEGMASAMPQGKFATGTPVTAGCRMVKDAHEIALMRHASEVTLMGPAAQAGVRHRHAHLPELRRRGAEDHRGHPRAAGDREDPHPPGAPEFDTKQRFRPHFLPRTE